MLKEEFNERRIFQRIPIDLSLRYRNQNSNAWGLAETGDVSARGVGIITEKELLPRTPLEIWLPIPNKGQSYYTKGRVVWSEPLAPEKYRAGIMLEKVDFMGISQVLREVLS